MIRAFFILIGLLVATFVYIRGEQRSQETVLPIFLRVDTLAQAHTTAIELKVRSREVPSPAQLERLEQDYSALWAHLNHLYATNDVEAGKEYYTEAWFRQICTHFQGIRPASMTRTDEEHHLTIVNWAKDGLVCTAVDSNAVLTYRYAPDEIKKTKTNLAIVLLFQGDHWRLDALRVIDENEVSNPTL